MDNAFRYIKDNGGIDTEMTYPYEAKDDKCRYKKQDKGADDKGFVDIPEGREDKLQKAVATVGPVSLCRCSGAHLIVYIPKTSGLTGGYYVSATGFHSY